MDLRDRPRGMPHFAEGCGRCLPLPMGRSTDTRRAPGGAGARPISLPRRRRPPPPDERAAHRWWVAVGWPRPLVRSGANRTGSGRRHAGRRGGGWRHSAPPSHCGRALPPRSPRSPTPPRCARRRDRRGTPCGRRPAGGTRRSASAILGSWPASPTATSAFCFLWVFRFGPPLPSRATAAGSSTPRLLTYGGRCRTRGADVPAARRAGGVTVGSRAGRLAGGSGDAVSAQIMTLAAGRS